MASQADVLAQMRQLYGRPMGVLGVSAMLWRLAQPALVRHAGQTR